MELILFGNTSLRLTKIGLGMASLGRPGYINLGHHDDLPHKDKKAMEEHAHNMLEYAWDLGIRYFDAARSYGAAEEFLGNWLQKEKRKCIIGSKWGYTYTADWQIDAEKHEVKEHSLKNLQKQWKETTQFLGNNINIYQIHSAKLDTGVLDNEEVLEELWSMREKGTIIGLSLSGPQQSETLEKALTIKNGDILLFQSVQATFNVLEPSAGPVLEKASQSGLGVIIKEAVANGRLTDKNREEKLNPVQEMADKNDVGMDTIAMAYVLSFPWVTTVLSGATTQNQLLSNCQAIEIRLTEEEKDVLAGLKEAPEDYWSRRDRLQWN